MSWKKTGQDVGDLQVTAGGVLEEFAVQVFHERFGVQGIGESARRKWTSHGSDMVSRERGLEQRV